MYSVKCYCSVCLTVAGRLKVVIVCVGLVVRVHILFLEWRRRRPGAVYPWRQEGTRHPVENTHMASWYRN